jgi:hypothetical protein
MIVVASALILAAGGVYSQQKATLPSWVDDAWRTSQYPSDQWYVGFAVGDLRSGANLAEVRKRVEKEAQNSLAEGITVRIQATSATHTSSVRTTTGGNASETVKKDYGQLIQTSTDAEVAKVELTSYHDQANNKIYALAKVKKADLAAYYVSRIEFYLQSADNNFKLAQQFGGSDKKRSALEKAAEAKKNVDECDRYLDENKEFLSIVVDNASLKSLKDRGAALRREIAAFETTLQESAPVFISGRETIGSDEVDIVIPGLQSKFTDNGCRIADNRNDAGYLLTVEVKNCTMSKDANFYYCNACVKATLENAKTGKIEAKLNFSSAKSGWTTEQRACEKALEDAAKQLWKEISEKTEVCR